MKRSRCHPQHLFHLLGTSWSLLILHELARHDGEGFNSLRRQLQYASPKMISQRLQELGQLGIIRRVAHDGVLPQRVSYHLTPHGKELRNMLISMASWYLPNDTKCGEVNCIDCPQFKHQHVLHSTDQHSINNLTRM